MRLREITSRIRTPPPGQAAPAALDIRKFPPSRRPAATTRRMIRTQKRVEGGRRDVHGAGARRAAAAGVTAVLARRAIPAGGARALEARAPRPPLLAPIARTHAARAGPFAARCKRIMLDVCSQALEAEHVIRRRRIAAAAPVSTNARGQGPSRAAKWRDRTRARGLHDGPADGRWNRAGRRGRRRALPRPSPAPPARLATRARRRTRPGRPHSSTTRHGRLRDSRRLRRGRRTNIDARVRRGDVDDKGITTG